MCNYFADGKTLLLARPVPRMSDLARSVVTNCFFCASRWGILEKEGVDATMAVPASRDRRADV